MPENTQINNGAGWFSKEFLQSVIDSSLDIIQVFKAIRNGEGRIIDFEWIANNRNGIKQNGDVIGKSALQLNPGMVPSGIFAHMVEVAETGVPWVEEKYYSYEQFNDQWYYQAVVKHEGGVMMTTRDITLQKKAEQEILRLKDELAKRATDKYLTLFNSIDEGFCIIEVLFDKNESPCDYRFLEANKAFEQQTGLTNAIGKTMKELVPEHEQYWFDMYGNVAKTGEPVRFENAARALGRYYNVYAFRIDEFSVNHVAVLFNDITERKKLEQQKEDFLGIASHELKTPVTSIMAYGQLLEQTFTENKDEESTLFIQRMNTQVKRLNSLISDLLDTTKLAEGQLILSCEHFDITELIQQLVEILQQMAKKHHLKIENEGTAVIHGDKKRIEQVITNLLSNAIKYSPEGGDVIIKTVTRVNEIEVSVTDSGIGIPEASQQKIFTRFFRVQQGTLNSLPGMGLGLYITAGIVQRHGGTISVKSKPGEGAVFTFTLPYNKTF
ncbi:MAG: PAS domain-containing sensor histidine kinase [Ferruginibacter sp.]